MAVQLIRPAIPHPPVTADLAAKGNSGEEVEAMHLAWCKSLQLQLALWAGTFSGRNES